MGFDRRLFLKGSASLAAVGAAGSWPRPARAAEFTFKAANNNPETHPLTIRMREAAANTLKESNGAVDIQIFPNNQLGSDPDMLSQLRSGALEFFMLSPLILSILVPNASITGIGFAWSGYDKVWPAVDGDLGEWVRGQIQKSGIYPFGKMWENGFRHITSSTRQILRPDDLKGFKIRVPPSPLWTSMFKAFDAAPMSIPFAEVYSALQTKIAEGQENPLALIHTAKLYEVQKYLSKTNHMWDGYWFLANGKVWSGLPADIRTVIEKNFNASAVLQREDVAKLTNSMEQELSGKGLQFLNVDAAAFRAKLASSGFYKEWRGKFGEDAWKLLESHTGAIS
jgi:tripartite ATP-independent transporter DctP family solute receptor